MTWTKLSDDFSDDCWQLSDAAWRLHVEGLVWSNRKLLDLVLRKDEMRFWAKRPEAAQELVDCGWWEDNGERYYIVHHGLYQRSAEAVLHQQKVNRANRAKRAKAAKPAREQARGIRSAEPPDTEPPNAPPNESLHGSSNEMDGTGQDGPGQEGAPQNELRLVAGDWPQWRGQGPSPFDEYR